MTDIITDETGAQRTIGYVLDVGQGDGRARCALRVDDRHSNRAGILHGGFAAALLDTAMGVTASLTTDPTGRAPTLTVSLNVNFLAAARLGDALVAVGWRTGGGRSLVFIAGELVSQDGTVIATATGVFKPPRPGL